MSDEHRILTRLHITDIETRTVYAVQASCVCGWLGRIRYTGEGLVPGHPLMTGAREAADQRAEHDGHDHLWNKGIETP